MTYDDVGGAKDALEKLREVVELPLLHPERFVNLGIDPPKVGALAPPPLLPPPPSLLTWNFVPGHPAVRASRHGQDAFRACCGQPHRRMLHPCDWCDTSCRAAVAALRLTVGAQHAGSELVQKYVGEGARLVRELFELARSKKACIVFFDEVDAIGGSRFEDGSGGDNEVQRTMLEIVNQVRLPRALPCILCEPHSSFASPHSWTASTLAEMSRC